MINSNLESPLGYGAFSKTNEREREREKKRRLQPLQFSLKSSPVWPLFDPEFVASCPNFYVSGKVSLIGDENWVLGPTHEMASNTTGLQWALITLCCWHCCGLIFLNIGFRGLGFRALGGWLCTKGRPNRSPISV